MSLSTKLNLMKLKSNTTSHRELGSSSHMQTSSSAPLLATFRNADSDESSMVSIVASGGSGSNTTKQRDSSSSILSSSPPLIDVGAVMKQPTKRPREKNLGTYDSNEEDSPESSGDEYVHSGFADEENKLVET